MKTIKILLIAIAAFAFGCDKDAPINPEHLVSFEFSNPKEGHKYPLGDTVHIAGKITAEMEMHGYELELINTSNNNEVLLYKHAHEDAVEYLIQDMWVNNITAHGNLELKITAVIDHEGTEASKTYYFMAQPI